MNVNLLLDKCIEVCGVNTDSELAAKLRVSKQAVSGWRHGRRLPDAVTCATIAGLTGEPLARVIGVVEEARAISREEKAVWRKLAATATLLLLAVVPSLNPAAAYPVAQAEQAPGLCIMRSNGWYAQAASRARPDDQTPD